VAPDPEINRVFSDAALEGARRVDEWSVIEKKIPAFDLVFASDRAQEAAAELEFSEAQRRLLPLVDGSRDVRGLVDESGLTEYEACLALYGLLTAGLVHRTGTSAPPATGRSLELQIESIGTSASRFFSAAGRGEREFRQVAELIRGGRAPFYLRLSRQQRWWRPLFRHAPGPGSPPAITTSAWLADR
jgi:hypothetical protein